MGSFYLMAVGAVVVILLQMSMIQDVQAKGMDSIIGSLLDPIIGLFGRMKKTTPQPPAPAYKRLSKEQKTAVVDKHNSLRQAEGASDMAILAWDDVLGKLAQDWSSYCLYDHRDFAGRLNVGRYLYVGENIYASTDSSTTPVDAVFYWHSEKDYFDYESNTCAPDQMCGHYTQVVWSETTNVGCGMTFCPELLGTDMTNSWFIVCNYGEGGNMEGMKPFQLNPNPRKSDAPTTTTTTTQRPTTTTTTRPPTTSTKTGGKQGLTAQQKQAILDKHNSLRSKEGASNMNMLVWDDVLGNLAQSWSNGCPRSSQHRDLQSRLNVGGFFYVGENMYATNTTPALDPVDAVVDWHSEKTYYDYKTNTCAPGQMCEHYTQVVWAKTTNIGCGMTFFPKLSADTFMNKNVWLFVCNYGVGGNMQGQWPFQKM